MRKQRRTFAEAGLAYIAASPPQEHGGFHTQTVRIAKAALKLIKKLRNQAKGAVT